MMLSKGCTQFTWPFGSGFYAGPFPRRGIDVAEGRSSGLRSILYLHLPTWLKPSSGIMQISSPFTAAGPLPNFTGFPIKPVWAPWGTCYRRLELLSTAKEKIYRYLLSLPAGQNDFRRKPQLLVIFPCFYLKAVCQ